MAQLQMEHCPNPDIFTAYQYKKSALLSQYFSYSVEILGLELKVL